MTLLQEFQQLRLGQEEPSSENEFCPLPVLKKLHKYPISFLAMLADQGAILSGSQSLEVFCPGRGSTQESDFDIYLLADPVAITDAMHTLRCAPVRWNNFLATYLRQIDNHGMALVPYLKFVDLATKIETPPDVLKDYLKSRFSNPKYSDFFADFNAAYGACWLESKELSEPQRMRHFSAGTDESTSSHSRIQKYFSEAANKVWIFTASGSTVSGVPDQVKKLLKTMHFDTLDVKSAKEEWKDMGWPETLLRGYFKSRINELGYGMSLAMVEINRVFGGLDTTDESDDIYHGRTTSRHGKEEEFTILQGSLPSEVKVQLMLVPNEKRSVLGTILGFYASHVMSGIGGTSGFHLYHGPAQANVSYEMDVTETPWKHARMPGAKEKFKPRGWTFKPLHNEVLGRQGNDADVKSVDYEYIYRSAMQDSQKLPEWWDIYFKSRRAAFESSSWIENRGKITHAVYGREIVLGHGLLKWVQENLSQHDDVIPKHEWDKIEERAWTQLDLWFGGAGALAHEMFYCSE
jgi:hypothetical protein